MTVAGMAPGCFDERQIPRVPLVTVAGCETAGRPFSRATTIEIIPRSNYPAQANDYQLPRFCCSKCQTGSVPLGLLPA